MYDKKVYTIESVLTLHSERQVQYEQCRNYM